MKNLKNIYNYFIFLSVFIFICCKVYSAETESKEAEIAALKGHFVQGMQKLDQNDLKTAEEEFNKAIQLNKKSPYGYTGMAFLEMTRSNYKKALKHVGKALKYDKNFVAAYAAKGRIITVRKHGTKWFEEALIPFGKALSLDSDNQMVLFFVAECYLKAQQHQVALEYLEKALEHDGYYTKKAQERQTLVTKIIRAKLLSERGGYIALDDKIDRSDLCILINNELRLKELLNLQRFSLFEEIYNSDYKPKEKIKIPPDLTNNNGKDDVLDIIALHITDIDIYPNGYFFPDRVVTRAQFAMVIQEIMVMVKDDPTLGTRYIGADSPFSDVHPDYYAFNAIVLCVEKGIMETDTEAGLFGTNGTVSGSDAILMFRALEESLKE